jgi:hypothetical protein
MRRGEGAGTKTRPSSQSTLYERGFGSQIAAPNTYPGKLKKRPGGVESRGGVRGWDVCTHAPPDRVVHEPPSPPQEAGPPSTDSAAPPVRPGGAFAPGPVTHIAVPGASMWR